MTQEERAYNYASTQKPTKLQVGEIAKHYNNGYNQAMQDFKEFIYDKFNIHPHDCHVIQYDSDTPLESMDDFVKQIENYMKDESEN